MQLDCSLDELLRLNMYTGIYAAAVATGIYSLLCVYHFITGTIPIYWIGGYISGLFGMNLNNTQRIQLIPNLFEMVCWSTGFGIILSTMLLIQYFR